MRKKAPPRPSPKGREKKAPCFGGGWGRLFAFWLVCLGAAAQTPVLLRQFTRVAAVAASVDNHDRVVAADAQGNITTYDTLGNALNVYSPNTVATVTSLEAWRSMQVLVFYRELQQFVVLDRFLTPLSGFPYPARVPPDLIGFARVMAPAYDDRFWVFDDTDFSLKKYDPLLQTVSFNSPLGLVLDARDYQITFMREYQNQLFVADAQAGVLVFDNLGNYRKKLPFAGLDILHFAGNELYYLQGKTVYFHDLYTQNQRQITLPEPARLALWAGRRLFVFTDKGGFLYDLR